MANACTFCGGTIVDGVCEDCGKPAKAATLITANMGGMEHVASVQQAAQQQDTLTTNRTGKSTRFTVHYPTRGTGTNATKTTRRRADVSTHTSTRRNALGGGLISLPDLPSLDPLTLLMATPEVPAHKRHCGKCDVQVNRSKGFCPNCGTPYDFEPHLKQGDVVAGKYEVKGPIAFGGLGWIYLGFDTVLSRYVVLKGLLNANDEASAAAAVAERRYLAAVKHPKIVGIYDFVNEGAEGFIVMEYVGGQTVHSLRKQRGPLPVAEAIAYILGILPAFSYLHAQGLVYCDFKPDNVMIEGGDVKLIDMGAVRKIGDPNGDIYATVGFCAPEADNDPTAVSDLYTLGRALALLIMDFKYASTYEHALPSPDECVVLAENESLYRFLLRATHVDPDERFQSADEMAEQLFGVLREIVALQSGPRPADSKVFTGDGLIDATVDQLVSTPLPLDLPSLRVNLEDRAATEVIRILSLMDPVQQEREFRALVAQYRERAVEPKLRLAELLIRNDRLAGDARASDILSTLDSLDAADPFDWRPSWFRAIWFLTSNEASKALPLFERCYFEMPGELAPRLGMGIAAEMAGEVEQALPYYERVGRVDPSYVSAHAGAARCHAKAGRLGDAIAALEQVPDTHALRSQAQMAIGELVLAHPALVDDPLLQRAEAAVNAALSNGGSAHQIAARLLSFAASHLKNLTWPASTPFLGGNFDENALRINAEGRFRHAARHASSREERCFLVSEANSIRPVTLF
ncbi:serine/threonine-protein kinase [Trinickia fusca]|uniref:Serine/threonine-protein kinase PknG n=1 Tax=Trinickia fusca TaxID=2419777 RepID=A0A494XLB8_9BURK|nr:serine/threonine-protein kinase [Trinickia fusca]RKP50532.1 serine/threonine protein kinase [Trinickia fusca]